jgi:hypothetical protein
MKNIVRFPYRESPAAEELQWNHRRGDAVLPGQEPAQEDRSAEERAEDLCADPAGLGGADESPDDGDDTSGEQDDADEVDPIRCAVALGEQRCSEQHCEQADRDVQPEDPLPVESLRDHPSDEGTRGDGQSRQPAIDADNQAPALGRERGGQDRQAERHDGGCSEALHRPGRDEVREVRGQSAESRGDGEQQQPEVEDGASSEPVTERRGRYDAGRERDAVGVDGPLQRSHGGMQVVLHVGQRADDDQGVEHYHEVGR